MNNARIESTCPISFTLDLFGDKWTLLIMRDILFRQKRSFSEFLASSEKIASNILVDRLNLLVNEDLIIKEISPENKSKFLYRPTQKGVDLFPLLCEMVLWADRYSPKGADETLTKPLKADRPKTISQLKKPFEQQLNQL